MSEVGDPPAKLVLGALAGTFTNNADLVSSPLSDADWEAIERERAAQWDRWLQEPLARRKRARRG